MLHPSDKEINYLISREEERFNLINPPISYQAWENSTVIADEDDFFGDDKNRKFAKSFEVPADYDFNEKIKKWENGVSQITNLMRVKIPISLLAKNNVAPKKGDQMIFDGEVYDVLSVKKTDIIQGTSNRFLFYTITIDTEQTSQD
ncbi:hypothetical protein M1M30_gp076 [Maribacter phage Colly_1]|uniref:Head-tail joining protein n=1 Tax=Maribacter phage Colly_1 TaxID=2745691 RepID=A0A8E4XY14_9CAUD|nr:hypothetical protein M1M30_gp076 [Maribacter phage Colly_1]QQO97362.1 hypothetical protein Colly1_76 [Maribacter phage Colly_1]